eukprot:9970430-Karenia_brevis.AAC.1
MTRGIRSVASVHRPLAGAVAAAAASTGASFRSSASENRPSATRADSSSEMFASESPVLSSTTGLSVPVLANCFQ